MPKLNYVIARLDLAIARNGSVPISEAGVGSAVDSVTVIQLPLGAVVDIAFNDTGESKFFPLLIQGQSFAFKDRQDCPLFVTQGIFVRNAAAAGILILMINFDSGE